MQDAIYIVDLELTALVPPSIRRMEDMDLISNALINTRHDDSVEVESERKKYMVNPAGNLSSGFPDQIDQLHTTIH